MVPQWDFLEMLANDAEREPSFTLLRNAEVTGLLTEGGRVVGVRYRDGARTGQGNRAPGTTRELRAPLTVACDGRDSKVRWVAGARTPRVRGSDGRVVVRLPGRTPTRWAAFARFSRGHVAVMLDRGDYWQCAYLIRKGLGQPAPAAGIGALRGEFAGLVPWVGDRVDTVTSWDEVKLLNVSLNRLRRWSTDGLLFIGDAAHAMSPVAGWGSTSRSPTRWRRRGSWAEPLRSGRVDPDLLRRVQRAAGGPPRSCRASKRLAHRFVLGRTLTEGPADRPAPGGYRYPCECSSGSRGSARSRPTWSPSVRCRSTPPTGPGGRPRAETSRPVVTKLHGRQVVDATDRPTVQFGNSRHARRTEIPPPSAAAGSLTCGPSGQVVELPA